MLSNGFPLQCLTLGTCLKRAQSSFSIIKAHIFGRESDTRKHSRKEYGREHCDFFSSFLRSWVKFRLSIKCMLFFFQQERHVQIHLRPAGSAWAATCLQHPGDSFKQQQKSHFITEMNRVDSPSTNSPTDETPPPQASADVLTSFTSGMHFQRTVVLQLTARVTFSLSFFK